MTERRSEPPINTLEDVVAAGSHGPPHDLPASSYELLLRSARDHAGKIALTFFLEVSGHRRPETWSYRRLFDGVTRTANLLHELGVRPGEVAAVMLPNLPETHLALWGGEAAGVVMPVNPLLEPSAIAALLMTAKARVLFSLAAFPGTDLYEKAVKVAELTPSLQHVVLVDITAHLQGFKRLGGAFLAWRHRRRAPAMPSRVQVHQFGKALARTPAGRLISGRVIKPEEVASYFCTGGTTGLPKIAVRTHGQEIANAWMAIRMLGPAMNADSCMFCGLPLFHVNAVIATGLAPFLTGARVVLGAPQGFRAPGLLGRFWEIIAYHGVSGFSGVPTLLASLLEHPGAGQDLSRFRYAFSGAAPLSAELLRRFEETCKVSVVEAYGLTETACVASMNPVDGERRAGSVGLPLPTQTIRTAILDSEGAWVREAQTDEIGVVTIAGPNVFSGYLEPEHNAGVWVDRGDGRRWLNTGDLGRIDPDGYLWLTGRAKDLIIRGGHNIDPSVIEEALASHPGVALAAAVGRPDAYAGEVPVAYVQLRPGASTDAAELTRHVAGRLGERAANPKAIIIVEALPLTMIGKIHKPTLRRLELAGVARAALDAAGVDYASVEALADERHGAVVRIQACPTCAGRIAEALAPYTFAREINADAR